MSEEKPKEVEMRRTLAPGIVLVTRLTGELVNHVVEVDGGGHSKQHIMRQVRRARWLLRDAPEHVENVEVKFDTHDIEALQRAQLKRQLKADKARRLAARQAAR